MATRFEIALFLDPGHDEPADRARLLAAGEAAIEEIRHWHARLSAFDPGSFVSHVNARAADAPVTCDPEFFALLALCEAVWRQSGGAFDPAIGAILRAAGLRGIPRDEAALRHARAASGFHLVHLDHDARTVRFAAPGMALDFGAVGKGFALDRAAERLRESGVSRAILHGGTSSVLALDGPPDPDYPGGGMGGPSVAFRVALGHEPPGPVIDLLNAALGVSTSVGREALDPAGGRHGHVLDPRTGASAPLTGRVAVVAPTAALADAWSTALLAAGLGAPSLPPGCRAVRW